MNTKAILAIALTMIIIVPVGMGYLLPSQDVERTHWEATDTASLSDLILNSKTAYYTDYSNPNNNTYLEAYHESRWEIGAPSYLETGTTYTSIPETTYTSGSPVTTAVDVPGEYKMTLWPLSVGSGAYMGVTSDSVTAPFYADMRGGTITVSQTVNGTDVTLYTESGYTKAWLFKQADGSMTALVGDPNYALNTFDNVSKVIWSTDKASPSSQTVYYYTGVTGVTLPTDKSIRISEGIKAGPTFNFPWIHLIPQLTVVTESGTQSYIKQDGINFPIEYFNGTLIWGDLTVNGVQSASLAGVTGTDQAPNGDTIGTSWHLTKVGISYTPMTKTPTGLYANYYKGWTADMTGEGVRWFNSQINSSAQFMLDLAPGQSIMMGTDQDSMITVARDAAGVVSLTSGATTAALGQYEFCAVTIDADKDQVKLEGMPAWPSPSSSYTVINTVIVPYESDNFSTVTMKSADSIKTYVSQTRILAGYFASTKDYELDMGAIWPGTSWTMNLINIGVYGDSIALGDTTYPVTSGQIEIGGQKLSLLSSTIACTRGASGLWTLEIGGNILASDLEEEPSVTFGGEWSLGARAYKMEEVTTIGAEWIPGIFGLDHDEFCAVGAAISGALFVILGLYGRRSGAKVILLAMLCGGAALLFLSLIGD